MLFCGCYVIGPNQKYIPFGVTRKTTLDGFGCLRHEQRYPKLQTVMASFVVKITFVVTEINFLGADIRLLEVKSTLVAAEITFKVAVITSSVDKISLIANINFVLAEMIIIG